MKIISAAGSAVKSLPSLLALLLLVAPTAAPAREKLSIETEVWAYRYIIVTSNNYRDYLAPIDRIRAKKEYRRNDLLDYLAEALVASQKDNLDDGFGRKEIVESLGRHGGPRYQTVIRRVATEWNQSPAREAALLFVRGGKPKGEQYIPGSMDLPKLRAAYATQALAATPTVDLLKKIAQLPPESTMDTLVAIAGLPQAVGTQLMSAAAGPMRMSRLQFYYRGIGRVEFARTLVHSGWWVNSIKLDPLAFEDYMPYRTHPEQFGQPDAATLAMTQLVSPYKLAQKLVLEAAEQRKSVPLDFLDTTAELLLASHANAKDDLAIDAASWMCVVLARDGGPRYSAVLEKVAASTTDDKLRRHAGRSVDDVKNVPTAPYIPGSISLAAQRARYPTLYPQLHFEVPQAAGL